MRRYAVLLTFLLVFSGCASWVSELRSNPVAAISSAVNYFQSALGLARLAVGAYAAVNPDSNVSARFNELAQSVEQGLVVAQDGLRLAADTGGTPDVPALLNDAKQAMAHVHEFLAGLAQAGTRAASSTMRDALHATARAAGISDPSSP